MSKSTLCCLHLLYYTAAAHHAHLNLPRKTIKEHIRRQEAGFKRQEAWEEEGGRRQEAGRGRRAAKAKGRGQMKAEAGARWQKPEDRGRQKVGGRKQEAEGKRQRCRGAEAQSRRGAEVQRKRKSFDLFSKLKHSRPAAPCRTTAAQ